MYPDNIIVLGLILIGIFFLKGVGAIFIHRTILWFTGFHTVWLRTRLMEIYQNLPYTRYVMRNSAEYIQAIQMYTGDFAICLQFFLKLASEGIVSTIILIFLFSRYGAWILLLFILLVPFILGYDRFFKKWVREAGIQKNLYNLKAIQGINEGVAGLKDIRILGKEQYFLNIVQHSSFQTAKLSLRTQVIAAAPRYLLEILLVSFLVALVIGSILYKGQVSKSLIPMLTVFSVASLRLLPAVTLLTSGLTKLRHSRHGVGMIYKDLYQSKDKNK